MTSLWAQGKFAKSDKTFRFVYIAHDVNTPVARLVERLREVRNNALDDYEDVVFYLANGANPIIVEFNVGENNQSDFDDILLVELNDRNSHNVDAETDKATILDLLNGLDIIDANKRMKYESTQFNFYITPNYWNLKNNDFIIAPLFFALDIPNIKGGQGVQFQIMEPKEDRLPDGDLFSEKNIDGINTYTKNNRRTY